MSKRAKISNALVEKLKEIDGTGKYNTNLFGNAYPTLKFWDEVQDFPSVYLIAGNEIREYHPAGFSWAYLNISIKCYVKNEEDAQGDLELLLEDLETCIEDNRQLLYDAEQGLSTTEILVQSIITDEGLLVPYGVGEINLQVRYARE